MFDFWYFELVPPSVCSGVLPLLCPSCPLSRESSHVVAVLTGWSLTCHLLISSNTRCRCSALAPVMVYIALTQVVSFAAQAQVLEHFAPASSAYAGRSCKLHWELNSPPVVPTVYTCTDGEVHRDGTSSLCCTCACHGVHCAYTSSVLRRASTSTGVLRACVFSKCRTFCKLQQRVSFSPCRAHRLHLHLWWSTSRRHQQFMLHLRL